MVEVTHLVPKMVMEEIFGAIQKIMEVIPGEPQKLNQVMHGVIKKIT